jgi:uncharacterized membrane protein
MTKVLEAIAVIALLLMIAMPIFHWSDLPDRFPTHYNAQGDPDGWGNKSGTLYLPAVAATVFVLLSVLARRTGQFNLAIPVDKNRPEVRAELLQMVTALKALIMVTLAYLYGRSMAVATGHSRSLGLGFLPFAMAAVWPVLGYYIWRLRRYRTS